jgi:hypothetical protein
MEKIDEKRQKMADDALISFVNSEIYNKTLTLIIEKTGIKINPDYKDVIQKRDTDHLNKIDLSIEYCNKLLENDYGKIMNFIIEKIKKYSSEKDTGGDFAKGEGTGKDEQPVLIENLGYVKSIIVMYIAEYYLLKERSDELLDYIKYLRIPQAKKYEKELKGIYKKI